MGRYDNPIPTRLFKNSSIGGFPLPLFLSSFSACHPCIALQLKFSTIPTLKHGFLRLCLGGENTSPLLRFPLVQIQSVSPFTSFYSPSSLLSNFHSPLFSSMLPIPQIIYSNTSSSGTMKVHLLRLMTMPLAAKTCRHGDHVGVTSMEVP